MKTALPAHMGHTVRYGTKSDQDSSEPLSAAAVETLIANAVEKAITKAEQRRPSKAIFDGRPSIEVPVSWCKGNLPLHGKQLLNLMLKRPVNDGIESGMLSKGIELGEGILFRMRKSGHMGKALTSTGSTTGDEYVPTDLSSELQRRMYLASNLVALLALDEVDMPSQPFEWPLSTTRPTFYLGATENTATTASDPGSAKIVLDAKKLMAQVDFSYELDEDAAIAILPALQTLLGEAAADALEAAILNGDTTATHQDSDIHAVENAAQKAFKGLRKYALAVTALKKDLSTGGITDANLRAMKKVMAKYGISPEDLILVCGTQGQNDLEGMSEVSTVDKLGNTATIITGRLPKWRGVPIVTSAACREDLNASGVYDNVTKDKGSILLFNRREFMLGRRREFTVEVDRDITKQQHTVVASFRRAFTPHETPSATIPTVTCGYNYAA